ncbi:hypothetical protein [Carboxydothermus ferrireducens]|uniref:OB-fold nucleic acid binding domain-containing protein n=1 Tax=Carboxydothermus ferrireducens DSM 11255 TaxID=1119529 RepID=A0ABX2R7V1_9THEO|nr:hypothetical protein [Carboxydothermus ferrireducens]NYE56632.1 hypothetical protein [Carboxydothermus ferrireducens DSM 11255]
MKRFWGLLFLLLFGFNKLVLGGEVIVKGIVVESDLEGKHYELKVTDSGNLSKPEPYYVLYGEHNWQSYVGKEVVVEGTVFDGYSIYMKPGLKVTAVSLPGEKVNRTFKENLPYYLGLVLVAGLFGYYIFLRYFKKK